MIRFQLRGVVREADSGSASRVQRRLDARRRERYFTHARAGRVEDRVAERGRHDRDRRFAGAAAFVCAARIAGLTTAEAATAPSPCIS